MTRYGNPKRTDVQRRLDAILWIENARPDLVLAEQADRLCDRLGVTQRDNRRMVEVRLLARQARLRREGV